MKIYQHWLKVDGYSSDESDQLFEIEEYLRKYPSSKITIHQYTNDLFHKVVLLECEQDYSNLDMKVNSGFNNLKRLSRKPRNIAERMDLKIVNGEIVLAVKEYLTTKKGE